MASPSLSEFLDASRELNPGVGDDELSSYWRSNYGRESAPSLERFMAEAKPQNKGVPDEELTSYWRQNYGALGAPEKEPGDVGRGFKTAMGQTVPILKGAVGLVGATAEKALGEGGVSTAVKEWGLKGFEEGMQKLQPLSRETDDVTVAWGRAKEGDVGALVDWVQFAFGYGMAQVAETAAVGVAGGLAGGLVGGGVGAVPGAAAGIVGKQATKSAIKALVEKAVERRVAAGMTEAQAARSISRDIGAVGALSGYNVTQEAGSIYPEAVKQAGEDGRTMTGSDLARVWGSAVVAGASETVPDVIGLGALAGRFKNLLPGGRATRAATGAAGGIAIEAGQETFQTAVERFGAQKPLDTDEAINEYINAAAMAAVPGAVVGGTLGGFSRARSSPTPVLDTIQSITQAKSADEAIAATTSSVFATPLDSPVPALDEFGPAAALSSAEPLGGTFAPPLPPEIKTGPRTQESALGAIRQDAEAVQAEAVKNAQLDALQAARPEPSAMELALGQAKERSAIEQTRAQEREARDAEIAARLQETARQEALRPQDADLPALAKLARHEPLSEPEQATLLQKGLARRLDDGAVRMNEQGFRAYNRLRRAATPLPTGAQPPSGPLSSAATAAPAPAISAATAPAAPPETPNVPAVRQQLYVVRPGGQKFPVDDVLDASRKWREFARESGGGVSDIGNGVPIVDQDGKEVARISYNGRVWPPGQWKPDMKPLYEADGGPANVTPAPPPQIPVTQASAPPAQPAPSTMPKIGGRPVANIKMADLRKFARGRGKAAVVAQTEISRREEDTRQAKIARDQEKAIAGPSKALISKIIEWGGINSDTALDILGDKGVKGLGPYARLFRHKKREMGVITQGHGVDDIALRLMEDGWITREEYENSVDGGVETVKDMIRAAVAGELQPQTDQQVERRFEAEMAARREAHEAAQAEGIANPAPDDVDVVDDVARAVEIDPDGFERLAIEYEGRPDAEFRTALKEFLNEYQRQNAEADTGRPEARAEAAPAPTPEAQAPAEVAPRSPWQLPLAEWLQHEAAVFGDEPKAISQRSREWHKGQVLTALRDGKPVPDNVLSEYPDLQKSAEVAPAPQPEAAPLALVGESETEIRAREEREAEQARQAKAEEARLAKEARERDEKATIRQRSEGAAAEFDLTGTEAVDRTTQRKIDEKAAQDNLTGQRDLLAHTDEQAKPARTDKIGAAAGTPKLEQFLSGMTPQEAGAARSALSKSMTFREDGKEVRGGLAASIEAHFADGWRVALTASGPAFVDKNMSGWSKRDIGEYGMQYANWISSQAAQPEAMDEQNAPKVEAPAIPEPRKGDRFKDDNGDTYEVWSTRHDRIEAFRVVNGKMIVHSGAAEYWALTPAARARYPDARTDYNPIHKERVVTPQVASPSMLKTFIGIAADSIEQLRKVDVDRVLTSNPKIYQASIASHIKEKRPDLADEVDSVLAAQPTPAAPPAKDDGLASEPESAQYRVEAKRDNYSQDLFGDPIRAEPAQPESQGVSGDVQPASEVPRTQAPEPAVIVEPAKTGILKVGFNRIRTPEQAAHVFQSLRDRPREYFQILLTNANDKPLAVYTIGVGTLTQTSVYPREVLTAAYMTPGAKKLWMAHNHPSGIAEPSSADRHLTSSITNAGLGADVGIYFAGHIVIGENDATYFDNSWNQRTIQIPPPSTKYSIPILERMVTSRAGEPRPALNSPHAVRDYIRHTLKPQEPGLILLDAQNRVMAWLPMSLRDMAKLRTGDTETGAGALFRTIGKLNPGAVIAYAKTPIENMKAPVANIGAALKGIDVKMLDGIAETVTTVTSMAERGYTMAGDVFFSRDAAGGGSTVESVRAELGLELGKTKAGRIRIVQGINELPAAHIDFIQSKNAQDAAALYDKNSDIVWMVADNIQPGKAFSVAMHDIGVHKGMQRFLGDEDFSRLKNQIKLWSHGKGDAEHFRLARKAAARVPENTGARLKDEELLAYFIEEAVMAGHGTTKPSTQGPIQQWFARLWEAVRNAITKLGGNPSKLTTDDIVALARGSLERTLADGKVEQWSSYGEMAASRDNESVQERGEREYAENWARVTGLPDFSTVNTRDLERARGFGERMVAYEKRKGWEGTGKAPGTKNEYLIRSAEADIYAIEQELAKRPKELRASRPDQTQTPEFKRWFGESKVVDAQGRPLVVYHGTNASFDVAQPRSPIAVFRLNGKEITEANSWDMGDDRTGMPDGYHYGALSDAITMGAEKALAFRTKEATPNHLGKPDTERTLRDLRRLMGGELTRTTESRPSGNGMWFTPDRDYSFISRRGLVNDPGANVMPVYLNIRNPIYLNASAIEGAGYSFKVEEFKKQGYDGAIFAEDRNNLSKTGWNGATQIVAFDPEQIKSAIGNSGQFDPENPDIRFSRGGQIAQDIFRSDRRLNRIISKVNTPFHIAETHPEFKPVYDAAQEHVADTSRISLGSADQAPELLPRIEAFEDFKRKAPSKADIEAISRALYAGTFYGGGNPMEGRVWTDAELKGQESMGTPIPASLKANPLNDAQIKLYRQALAAVGHSLEEHSKALTWRLARNAGIDLDNRMSLADMAEIARQQADGLIDERRDKLNAIQDEDNIEAQAESAAVAGRDSRQGDRAAEAMRRKLAKDAGDLRRQIDELEALKASIDDIETKTNGLKEHGYMPAMRFGEYYVDVYQTDVDGKVTRHFFGKFERQAQANAAKRELQAQYPDATVDSGLMNKDAHKLMNGVSLDTMEMFAEHIQKAFGESIDIDPIMQEYFRMVATERSTLAREIHRKGVPGQSDEIPRVLAQFVTSNARQAASTYHTADMLKSVKDIGDGDLQAYATRFVRYLQDPQEEWAKVRGLVANYYLMGSAAFGAINLTQPIMVTAPRLSEFVGVAGATAAVVNASRDVVRGKASMKQDERDAYERAQKEGIVSPQEIHQLRAESAASVLGKNLGARKALFAWGAIYSLTEQFNRGTSFLAAYRIAKGMTAEQKREHNVTDPYDFAKKAVAETQFMYNRANRPELLRGPGAVVLQFKQFAISYVELATRLYKSDKKAFAFMMLALIVAAGLEGLPGAEDIEDAIDTIGQKLGYAVNSKKSLRKFATMILGPDMADILLHGASAIPGFPLDVSMRMGMQNLLPGTAMFKTSEPDKTREIIQALGPAASIADRVLIKGDKLGLLPKAMQDIVKAGDMTTMGLYRDYKGRKIVETDEVDAFFKAVGFQPASVARASRIEYEAKQDIDLHKVIEDSIATKWSQGIFEKDSDKIAEARETLRDWNEDNPELRVRITMQQLARRVQEMRKTREQRFEKQAAPEIRSTIRREMLEAR